MLSYCFAWAPLILVVTASVVLTNPYMASIGVAIVALLPVALVVGLVWSAAEEMYALRRRRSGQ